MEFYRELARYCDNRISQLREFEQVLGFFNKQYLLTGYIQSLQHIRNEVLGENSDELKRINIKTYIDYNPELLVFSEDIRSILQTGKKVLPDSLLEIEEFKAERERKRKEKEAQEREEQHRQQREEFEREFEQRQKRWQLETASKLGISASTLAKLQGESDD